MGNSFNKKPSCGLQEVSELGLTMITIATVVELFNQGLSGQVGSRRREVPQMWRDV